MELVDGEKVCPLAILACVWFASVIEALLMLVFKVEAKLVIDDGKPSFSIDVVKLLTAPPASSLTTYPFIDSMNLNWSREMDGILIGICMLGLNADAIEFQVAWVICWSMVGGILNVAPELFMSVFEGIISMVVSNGTLMLWVLVGDAVGFKEKGIEVSRAVSYTHLTLPTTVSV